MEELLAVHRLTITSLNGYEKKKQQIVKDVDFLIQKGEVVGIVGESGSGKSVMMKGIKGILPENFMMDAEVFFDGQQIFETEQLPISMIFQDPKKSLNPVKTVGGHLLEVIQRFQKVSKAEAREIAIQELVNVGVTQPEERLKQYPHELSGGICQRVMIAMALATKSQLLIADEPTTALDVLTQQRILRLLKTLQEKGLTIILISHDFQVIQQLCQRVYVMYRGKLVEEGTVQTVMTTPKDEYTKQLLAAMPDELAFLGGRE